MKLSGGSMIQRRHCCRRDWCDSQNVRHDEGRIIRRNIKEYLKTSARKLKLRHKRDNECYYACKRLNLKKQRWKNKSLETFLQQIVLVILTDLKQEKFSLD